MMNINDTVYVRLTPIGFARLVENHAKFFDGHRCMPEFTPPPTSPDGWTKFQMWTLMSEFGPHLHNGMIGSFFVDNEIRIF